MTRRSLPDHGTLSRYKRHGCKCLTCMNRWRDYKAHVARQTAYGRWQPLVDAEPVRAHVRQLMAAGIGIARIAELAGVSQPTIGHLLYTKGEQAPTRRMQRAKAAAVLAVRPTRDALADGAQIDATGTRRRLQALIAMGWTQGAIARHLGMHPRPVSTLVHTRKVTASTARRITAAYDQLWNADPLKHGVTAQAAARSRNEATRKGWPGPLAWDDATIDDPAATPDLGDTRNRPGVTRAEIEWLLAAGETDLAVIAARVGVKEDAVEKALERAKAKAAEQDEPALAVSA